MKLVRDRQEIKQSLNNYRSKARQGYEQKQINKPTSK